MFRFRKNRLVAFTVSILSTCVLAACASKINFDEMNKLLTEEKYEQLIEICDKEIEKNPKASDYLCYKGKAYLRQRKFKKASETFEKAIKLNPDKGWYYRSYGLALAYLHKDKEAIRQLDKSIELAKGNKDKAAAYTYRASAYHSLGNFSEVIKDTDKAIELDPQSVSAKEWRAQAYTYLGKYDEALADVNSLLKDKADDMTLHALRSSIYLAKGDSQKALQDAQKAVSINEDNWYAIRALADVHYFNKEYLSAAQGYKKIIAKFPNSARAHYDLAHVYICQAKMDEARKEAEISLVEESDHPCSLMLNGLFAALDGDAEKSNQYYERAKRVSSGQQTFIMGREVFSQMVLRDYDKALYLANSYLEELPQTNSMYRVRSEIYKRQGNEELAKADYDKAISKGYKRNSHLEDFLKIL